MLVRMKFRAFLVEWASRFSRRRAAFCRVGKRKNKTSAENCWLTFGKALNELCHELETKPVEIPDKVKVNIGNDGAVAVEGPKGQTELEFATRDQGEGRETITSRSRGGRKRAA